jgi:endonuclease/exonuclease/phosphatase family metal-dependent hydrolase
MKVITYNLAKGRNGRGSILEEAIHRIADRNPDLLLCQEVFHGVEAELDQSRFITQVIGCEHVFAPNAFRRRGCHGNATFARMAMARHVNIDLTESFFEKRGMLCTLLEGEHGPFEVLNTHFSLTGRQRRRQWFKLAQALPDDPDMPVLACGDFNDWSGALDRRVKRSGVLQNALWSLPRHARRSFPARRPVFGLDRIYFRGFRLASVQVLSGEPWDRLSDHLPVEAQLELL